MNSQFQFQLSSKKRKKNDNINFSFNHPKYLAKSTSGWMYHTRIIPVKNIEVYNPLNDAFDKFLKDLQLNPSEIKQKLEEKNPYRLAIRTDGNYDDIKISSTQVFQKSRFLINHKFKQQLIDYYNPIGIFVKGPKEYRKDGKLDYWIIELSPLYAK